MDIQKPAISISKSGEFKNSTGYIINCDCNTPEHQVNMWVEIDDGMLDLRVITVSFYVGMMTDIWSKTQNRFKLIWQLLTTGYIKYEANLVLSEQAALNMAHVILDDIKRMNDIKGNK